jgi:hypothetical protein
MPSESTFGTTLKAWFRANDWPQSVPEKLAKAKGNATGPWASQISHAMNDRHQPKTEFFMAMAWFNEIVATRDLAGLSDRRLIDQLREAQPLCHDNGVPYTAPDFFSLFTGLIEPPAEFAVGLRPQLTQEDVDEVVAILRENFKKVALTHMVSRKEAWEMTRKLIIEIVDADPRVESAPGMDDLDLCQEIMAGVLDPDIELAIRLCKRWHMCPLQQAFSKLLGGDEHIQMDRTESFKKKFLPLGSPLPFKAEAETAVQAISQ